MMGRIMGVTMSLLVAALKIRIDVVAGILNFGAEFGTLGNIYRP